MSYDGDQMQSLSYAIRSMVSKLDNFSSEFGKGKLLEALNKNNKVQETANLLRLYELSMARPELNLLTNEQKAEILMTIKSNILPQEPVKEEPKRRGFFR